MKINFLSLNLWEGGRLSDTVFPFIKEVDADIMCLQETIGGDDENLPKRLRTIEVLKDMFPGYDYYFSPEVKKIKPEGSFNFGNLILSKFPIVGKKHWFFGNTYNDHWVEGDLVNTEYPSLFQHAEVNIEGDIYNIFNVHGVWGFDGDDSPERDVMSQMVVKEIVGKEKVIMAGDFNCFTNTRAIKFIANHIDSVFMDSLKTTFNLKRKPDGWSKRSAVDMVFASREFDVIYRDQPQVDVSDHLPLKVTFEI